MLQKELKNFLTDTVGIDIEALKKALSSEAEDEVKFKSGTLLDDDAINALKETVKKDGYNEGKKTGVEMEAKRIKEKFNIEVEGKSFDNILSKFAEKTLADAKVEPNKKIDDLKVSLAKLQNQYETDISQKTKEVEDMTKKVASFKVNSELSKYVPEKLKGVNNNQFLALAKMDYTFGFEDDAFVAKKGDKIVKDKMEKVIPVSDILTSFGIKNGWLDADGRGGGDEGGAGELKTVKEVFDYMKENGIDPDSPEGLKLQTKIKQ